MREVSPAIDDLAPVFCQLIETAAVNRLITNLQTEVMLRPLHGRMLPVTVNAGAQTPTCYICCPSVAYVDYAREELRHFKGYRALVPALNVLLALGAPLIRAARLDHQVQPNNWLLATNPLPPVTLAELRAFTDELIGDWPDRVIFWRSLNDVSDRAAIGTFVEAGYQILAARQIYLFDCRDNVPKVHRDEQRDLALLGASDLAIVPGDQMTALDYQRAESLYCQLYLEKYTWLNPQYSALFLKECQQRGVIELTGLRAGTGELSGIIGIFDRGRVMTAPIVGYDTSAPQQRGLYRMLMALAIRRAREKNMLFNMSAGAAGFKRNRGGVPALEYSAVYNRHLPMRTRAAGSVVAGILARAGAPLLRTFEL